jgi:hypothetical protein
MPAIRPVELGEYRFGGLTKRHKMRALVLRSLGGQYYLIVVQLIPAQFRNLVAPLAGQHQQPDDRAVMVI